MYKTNTKDIPQPSNKGLVLIVDDEISICSTLQGVLEDENYNTVTSLDGFDAVLKAQSFFPDVVFLDIWMPGIDGIETLERIKKVSPQSEIIIISGHATISNALEATKRGAFDFIEKPLGIESILLATKRAIEKKIGNDLPLVNENKNNIISFKKNSSQSSYQHPGTNTRTLKGRNFRQRTLRKSAILYGQCLHSGQKSGLILEPLPLNSGIHFSRIGDSKTVPAFIDYVKSTDLATTLTLGSIKAATIEHLMATLCAYRISNLLIKCNGEVPIFDGSALEFCREIENADIEEQGGDWYEIALEKPIFLSTKEENRNSGVEDKQEEFISLEPASELSISYQLKYPSPIGEQNYQFTAINSAVFKEEIAPARTFGFLKDIEKLQKAGLAAGGRLDNFILIDNEKVVNTKLRFEEELARHKILDILGDLFLIGRPLRAKITANMSGHSDNINILKKIKELLH